MISQAGEWKSPAFLKYLDLVALDRDMVVQAHLDEESEDDDLCRPVSSSLSCFS